MKRVNVGKLSLDNVEKYGEYTSLHFEGRSFTNTQRNRFAGALAAVLKERGIGPGDHVVVMMPNCPDVTAAFQAVWKLGAVIIPVTPMLNAREAGYVIDHSDAKAVVTSPVLAARVKEAMQSAPKCRHLLVIGSTDVEGGVDIEPEIAGASPIETLADRGDDDLALLLYTSGTTGQPKGVMLTHRNMLSNAEAVAEMSDFPPRTPHLHVLPLSHSFGVMTMNVGYIVGAGSILLTHFDVAKVHEAIANFRVERFAAVPTMLTYMVNFPDRDKYDLSSLVKVHSGGASLPEEVRQKFEQYYDCLVKEGYGLSETAPTATGYDEDEEYRPGSVGRAIPGVEVRIADDEGATLEAGEHGEICIKGPNVMRGYWKNEEATRGAMSGEWLRSGDVGYMDEAGFVYITDRKKDLIIKGGENISPREIEEALYEHPAVAEVAVIGVPDPTYGENIVAVVALKTGESATEDELKAHTAKYVTKYKVPAEVEFTPMLPKNPVGKILKKDIRARVIAAREAKAVEG